MVGLTLCVSFTIHSLDAGSHTPKATLLAGEVVGCLETRLLVIWKSTSENKAWKGFLFWCGGARTAKSRGVYVVTVALPQPRVIWDVSNIGMIK
jgi:hypothetical protein